MVGGELIEAMEYQARSFGAQIRLGEVEQIVAHDGFVVRYGEEMLVGDAVILATGVVNHSPPIDAETHHRAIQSGLLRYCPVCDAYEITGKRVGVLGGSDGAVGEALFLKTYTDDIVFMLAAGQKSLEPHDEAQLIRAGIPLASSPATRYDFSDYVDIQCGSQLFVVDSLYVALGSDPHNSLARGLGLDLADKGAVVVDAHQRTSMPGVYAAGDLVAGLDQISVAMGQGAVAATAAHNDLKQR